MGWDQDTRAVASADRGLIDREQAFDLGLTPDGIENRIRIGAWARLHAGVYHLNVTSPDWKTEVRAAVLAAGPNALASHRTAAILYGIDGFRGRMIEVTVPYTKQPMPEDVIVHRTRRRLPPDLVDGIPLTSIERTLLDLAGIVPESHSRKR